MNTARLAVHAVGMSVVGLIVGFAAWTILHDRQIVLGNAETRLQNLAVLIAEQTREALGSADASIHGTIGKPGAAGRASPAAFHRYFERFYRAVSLGYDGRVALLRSDGVLLTTYPPAPEAAGRDYASHPFFAAALKRLNGGVLEAPGLIESDERIISYRQVQDYPLIVAVSAPLEATLGEWREGAVRAGIISFVFALLVTAGTWLLARQLRITQALTETVRIDEMRLQSIIGSAMDAIITVDAEQNVVLFNAAAENIFGYPAPVVIGRPLDRLIPERYRTSHRSHVTRFGEAGPSVRRMGGGLVLFGLGSDGEEFPIDASISQVTVDGQKFYTVILRDITERQRAAEALGNSHQQLRDLYESMHQVREAERTRIARELHDELAQWLTALKMDVSWLGGRLPQTEEKLLARVQKMRGVVDSTVAAMRRIAAALRPAMLDDLGLLPAVEHMLQELSERTGIMVRLDGAEEDVDLHDPLATAVYRMVQEALTNVARHSGATRVTVAIRRGNERLHVAVRDNGSGLRPAPNHKSFGLIGIRERAATLGGSARIYTAPEGGTAVEIEVPLQRQVSKETAA